MAEERIDSIIDIPAVKKEFDTVMSYLDELGAAIKTSSNPSGAGALTQTFAERKAGLKEVQAETEKLVASEKKLETQIDNTVAAAKEAQAVNEATIKALKTYNGTLDENIKQQIKYKTQLADIRERQKALTKDFTGTAGAVADYERKMHALVLEEKQLKAASLELNNIVRNQIKEMNAAGGSVNELRAQLNQLKAAADTMDIGSAEFKQAQVQITALNDKIKQLEFTRGDFQRDVGNYRNNWTAFNQTLRETPAFANGVQTGLMGISNNLPMFADEVKKARDAGQSWKEILKGLGGAMFSFGGIVTIITTALTFLPSILKAMSSETEKAAQKTKTLTEVQTESFKATQKEGIELQALMVIAKDENKTKQERSAAIKKINDIMPDYLGDITEEEIRSGKATEKITAYIGALQKKALAQAYMSKLQEKYIALIDAENTSIEDNIQWYNYLWNNLKTGGNVSLMAIENMKTGTKNRYENVKAIREEISALGDKFKADLESGKAILDLDKTVKESKEKTKKENDDSRERELRAQMEVSKINLEIVKDMWESISENTELAGDQRINALYQVFEKQKQIAELERDFLLKNEKLTASERLKVKLEAQRTIAGAELKMQEEVGKILKASYEQQKKDAEKAAAERIKTLEGGLASRMLQTQMQLNSALMELNKRFLAGEIASVEEFEKQKEDIISKFSEKTINEQIANLRRVVAEYDIQGKDATEILKKISDLQIALSNQATEKVIGNKKKEDKQNKETADNEEARQKKLAEMKKQLASETINLIASVVQGGYDRQKNAIEDQIIAIENNKKAEIDRINFSTMSEQEKADKIKIIEAKAAADREALERKKKEVDIKKAKFERDRTIFEIAANTAVAISKAVAAFPLTGGMPFAAIAAAIGAVQIAAVLARPLPKFEKGTSSSPEGWAITDEKGPEQYVEPDGTTYMGSDKGPTLRYLKRGTRVIPHDQVNKMMLDSMMSNTAAALSPQSDNQTAKELRGLKDVMYWQTKELQKAYGKNRAPKVNIIMRGGWDAYIEQSVRQ